MTNQSRMEGLGEKDVREFINGMRERGMMRDTPPIQPAAPQPSQPLPPDGD